MVNQDGAIGIDMNQRPRLVQMCSSERNAELDGNRRKASFQHFACRVELADFFAATTVLTALFKLIDQLVNNVVFDQHFIGRYVAFVTPIEVALAHVKRVNAQTTGNVVQHVLDTQDSLWTTKPAESRVGLRIGFYPQ